MHKYKCFYNYGNVQTKKRKKKKKKQQEKDALTALGENNQGFETIWEKRKG